MQQKKPASIILAGLYVFCSDFQLEVVEETELQNLVVYVDAELRTTTEIVAVLTIAEVTSCSYEANLSLNFQFPVAVVSQHLVYYLRNLLLQFVDESAGIILLVLYVAQLLLPQSCKLRRFQQFLVYYVNQGGAGGGCHYALALTLDVVAFEQSLYYVSP